MITTDDDAYAARIRSFINHGQSEKYLHTMIGYNYRMTDIGGAIGRITPIGFAGIFTAPVLAGAAALTGAAALAGTAAFCGAGFAVALTSGDFDFATGCIAFMAATLTAGFALPFAMLFAGPALRAAGFAALAAGRFSAVFLAVISISLAVPRPERFATRRPHAGYTASS